MIELDAMLSPEVREHVRQMAEVWLQIEEAEAAGLDAEELRRFVERGTADTVKALAQYRVAALKPAIDAAKAEERRIRAQRLKNERLSAWLGEVLGEMMDALGESKIAGPLITVSRVSNPPRVVMEPGCDLSMLPDDYVRVTREVDRSKVGEDLKHGVVVPGFHLESTRGVRVR